MQSNVQIWRRSVTYVLTRMGREWWMVEQGKASMHTVENHQEGVRFCCMWWLMHASLTGTDW